MRTLFGQAGKSARGLAQSRTLRDRLAGPSGRQLLDCASPLALLLTRLYSHPLGRAGKDLVISKGVDHTFHPYGQKVKVYEDLLRQFSKVGDVVLDPFGGGGTVAQACFNLGRKCITCEIERKHFVTIHKRIFGRPPGTK